MSDTFDHELDAFEDGREDYGPRVAKRVKCRHCGIDDLRWKATSSRPSGWMLVGYDNGYPHTCDMRIDPGVWKSTGAQIQNNLASPNELLRKFTETQKAKAKAARGRLSGFEDYVPMGAAEEVPTYVKRVAIKKAPSARWIEFDGEELGDK